jgi:hypothetical protein
MLKLLSAGALLAACSCGGIARAQTVEYRIVEEALSGDASSVIAVPPSPGTGLGASNLTGNYAVQVRVTAGPGGIALAGFSFDIVILNEPDANGQLTKMRISNPDGSYFTGSPMASPTVGVGGMAKTYTYLAGINSAFNGQINASLGTYTNNPAEQEIGLVTGSASGSALLGTPGMDPAGESNVGTWSGYGHGATPPAGATAPLDGALGPTYFGQGQFIDIYRFRYTISNTTGRALSLTLANASAQVFSNFVFNNGSWGPQATTLGAAGITVTPLTVVVGTPGACCDLGSGNCTTVLESLCTFGTFSVGTCAPNPCPEPQGQCCDTNGCTTTTLANCPQGNTWTLTCCNVGTGACTTTTQPGCTSGSAWMVAPTCTPNPCPAPPQGSCCVIATGACSVTTQIDCVSGSAWTLAGTCTPNTCVQPLGACCAGIACTNTTQASCAVGNVWTLGAVCSGGICPGTCCNLTTGACSIRIASNCGLATNTWSAGGMCTPNPCVQPVACCTTLGQCALSVGGVCQNGGTLGAPGSVCSPNTCPQVACCASDGSCTFAVNGVCGAGMAFNGHYSCTPNMCAQPGACCGNDCQLLLPPACTLGRMWMQGACTPSPCAPATTCCNPTSGQCSVVFVTGNTQYSYAYGVGSPGYARSDTGGKVESIAASFSPNTRRLVFDVSFSGATSGAPLTTAGFWLVLDYGPDPKHHPGELAIFYFDASTLASPALAVYAYNGADAGTSWSDGDPVAAGNQAGDLIKGINETAYISMIVAEDTTVSGQPRRHFMFDVDATDIIAHTPLYPAASPWYGTGFDISLGIWFHPVGGFAATYESGGRGAITSLAISDEGWLDGAFRTTNSNDPCPSNSRITLGSSCTPTNTCPPRRACCGVAGVCVLVGPTDDCPANSTFASPDSSTCSPNPCPSLARQPAGACCNALTSACCVIPASGCDSATNMCTWSAGGSCTTGGCPAVQGACCNVVTGTCCVCGQSGCGAAAHDWVVGSACASSTCAIPGICCNTAAGTCRRLTQSRCTTGCTWAPSGVCSPSPCSLPGPCCNVVTGTCQITTPSACPSAAHEWMPASACSPGMCASTGICCNTAAGTCRRLTQAHCTAGSTWASTGVCSPNPCVLAGPCCNVVTGACQLLAQAACPAGAHDWTADSTCAPSPCSPIGACCTPTTGACRLFTQARCSAANVWVAGGVCSPSPCFMPQGSCCNVVVGTCAITSQADCAPAAHDWFSGGVCASNACDVPAACCDFSAGLCRRLTQIRCMSVEGHWLSGQVCTSSPCGVSLVTTACAADFDRSGHADVEDLFAFLTAWFGQDLRADVNANGEIEVVDIFDFLTAWLAGC